MNDIAVTSIRQINVNHLYYDKDEALKIYHRSKEAKKKIATYRPNLVNVENNLLLKLLHFYHTDESDKNAVMIVVQSLNDPLMNSSSTQSYFALYYQYSDQEKRFVSDDIGKTISLMNFFVAKVPKFRVASSKENHEASIEWSLENYAIVASKDMLNSSYHFVAEENEEISSISSQNSLTNHMIIDEIISGLPAFQQQTNQQVDSSRDLIDFVNIINNYAPNNRTLQCQNQVNSAEKLLNKSGSGFLIDEYSPQTRDALIQQTDQEFVSHQLVRQQKHEILEEENKETRDSNILENDENYLESESSNMEDGEQFDDANAVGDSGSLSEILSLVNETVINGMNVPEFLRNNISIIKFEDIELEPINVGAKYFNVNIIGILKRIYFESRFNKVTLELFDENDSDKFIIPSGGFSCELSNKLRQGQLICLRNITSKTCSAKSLLLIDVNDFRSLKIFSSNNNNLSEASLLYKNEIARVCELLFHSFDIIPQQLSTPYPSLFGLILAKMRYDKISSAILLLPEPWSEARVFKPKCTGSVIYSQLPRFTKHSHHFSPHIYDYLIDKCYIVEIILYDEHDIQMKDIPVLASVVFYGLARSAKKDMLILRGENSEYKIRYGKCFVRISDHSFPVQNFWSKMESILLGIQPTIAENFSTQITKAPSEDIQFEITANSPITQMNSENNIQIETNFRGKISLSFPKVFILRHPEFEDHSVVEISAFSDLPSLVSLSKTEIFKIRAKMIDYMFTSNNAKIINLAVFRRQIMSLLCSTSNCDFHVSYEYFYSQIAKSLLMDISKMPECPRCYNTLKIHLRIGLTFQDEASTYLKMLFMSPFVERSINCDEKQLMFGRPDDRKLVKAIDYLFASLCPVRNNSDNPFKATERSSNEQNSSFFFYFRKFEIKEVPPKEFHPSSVLFSNMSEPFVFELMAIQQCEEC